jgi:hypothetical protein
MDVLGAQFGIAPEPSGCEQRARGAVLARLAVARPHQRAGDRAVIEEALGLRVHEQLTALADDPLAGQQQIRRIGLASPPVAEHRHRIRDMHAE